MSAVLYVCIAIGIATIVCVVAAAAIYINDRRSERTARALDDEYLSYIDCLSGFDADGLPY